MKTLLLISTVLIAVTIFGISKSYAQYGESFSPVQHYPPTNDTKLQLIVMNSTEFKGRTTGYNYAFAGIDYNWASKGNNNYDFGGARVTFLVSGFENGTTKGEAFNLDSQMNVKSVFEYDADRPPAGYRSDTCHGCLLPNASQANVDKFHIGHVADGTYNETAALQRSTQLMNMQNEKMAEKQNLEVQLATKQHDYDDAIKNSNATKISSLLGDINEIKNQTSSLQEQIDKITQEINVIQEANIQFYYMDPVLLKKYQAASDGFVTKIQVKYWKGKSFDEQKNAFPLVGIGVDSKKKSVEITLWKGIENSTNVDRYISVIKELMPSDVPWHVGFGEYPTAYYSTLTMHPLQQVNSGILAKNVTCNQNLELIFKAEDGSPTCVKPSTASVLLQRNGWTMVSSHSNNPELNNTSQNERRNYLPNISQRLINMTIGGNVDALSYLPVMISDKIILEKPSDSVILQKLHPDWENRKSQPNSFFEVSDENGNSIGASFFQQDTMGIESLSPSADMIVTFGNPFSMPIRNIASIAIITYSMDEIGPTNSTYHLKFASLYPVNVNLPRGIELVSNNTKTYSEFWTKDYSGNTISSNSTYIQYGYSNIQINSIILYDLTFRIT